MGLSVEQAKLAEDPDGALVLERGEPGTKGFELGVEGRDVARLLRAP